MVLDARLGGSYHDALNQSFELQETRASRARLR